MRRLAMLSLVGLGLGPGCEPVEVPLSPAKALPLAPVASFSLGVSHLCAILENGDFACAGENGSGQFGLQTPTFSPGPLYVPLGAELEAVSAGGRHSCGIIEDSTVVCWGDNRSDQLGFESSCTNDLSCRAEPQIVATVGPVLAVASGGPRLNDPALPTPRSFTCAIASDRSVSCWGAPNALTVSPTQGLEPSPRIVSDVGGSALTDLVTLEAGESEVCAVDGAGGLWCWGPGRVARRRGGLSPVVDVAIGAGHTCVATGDGEVVCWGENLNGQSGGEPCLDSCEVGPRAIGFSDAVAVAAGGRHSCALRAGGEVYCWGSNQVGQLGTELEGLVLPAQRSNFVAAVEIDAGEARTCALDAGGTLFCNGVF